MLRATYHDTNALIREFRRPLLVFLMAVFAGGYVYRELMVGAGLDRLPYLDMPYIMLALMVLETPVDVPREPALIMFWYVMPTVAVYIIGRGAVDFFRLFFDRSERRDAWEEAVASTYRNHVIVLGMGHVGTRVVRTLAGMGFDVVAIDLELDSDLDAEMSGAGVPCILGDGRTVQTLETAGLRRAQALIVCTSNDHVNLEAIMRARDMNPDVRIVARMWDSQFATQLERFMNVQAVMSSSDLAAPAFAGMAVGIEITQTLKIHGMEYSMIRLTVEPNSFLDGETIHLLEDKNNMDIVLHGRDSELNVHPDGAIVVRGGDTLVIFDRHDKIISIVARNRRGSNQR
jgi:Trk K+ transport system NAD-binding subunit